MSIIISETMKKLALVALYFVSTTIHAQTLKNIISESAPEMHFGLFSDWSAIVEHFIAETPDLSLVKVFEYAIEAVTSPEIKEADVLFLDIEMPHMTGLELLDALDSSPLVVLVSSKSEYAIDAFNLDVVDYLLKPVTYGRFLKAISRIRSINSSKVELSPEKSDVFVKSDGKLTKVLLEDIQWIEAQRDYVLIHTDAKQHFIHSTMKRLSDRLKSDSFIRVHRSFIVRFDKITDIQDSSIAIGKKVIPIGASFKEALMRRIDML